MSKVWRPVPGALWEAAALVGVVASYFERLNAKELDEMADLFEPGLHLRGTARSRAAGLSWACGSHAAVVRAVIPTREGLGQLPAWASVVR